MASKWLEERWEVLMPVLGQLGCAQEEQIKSICEAELNLWRQRPSLKQANSLRKPLTDTRNHIRVSLPVTEENGWINPKSNELEHLALKYLNFSTEEWMQMNKPPEEKLQTRLEHPLPLSNPSALLSKAEQLVQMNAWPELVVGIALSTGRGLVEVLHTGHFTAKSAYSVDFAGPMTIYEQMCDPFEVPTLVRAELVLAALHQLRGFFGNHFEGVARREISRQCTEPVREAAYQHLLGLLGLHEGERNIYKVISHGVYPRLASWCYCPAFVDEILYMATIQNHRKILEEQSLEERSTLAVVAGYMDYVVVDATGVIDQRRGIRLGEPEVEVLIKFQEKGPEVASDPSQRNTSDEKGGAVMDMQWLEKRVNWLGAEIAKYEMYEGEEEIRAICEAEMEAWKGERPTPESLSFQEMVMQTRICLRTHIPFGWNEWCNPETGEWEHIGLKYLHCTEAEWEEMKVQVLSQRLLLQDPETIVSRASKMLHAPQEAWPEWVVGIAVLTGQRMMRILKNARFSQKSAFSLLVRDVVHYHPFLHGPFEVPTLFRADLVVEAWERLRNLVDCGSIDEQEIARRYYQVVRDTASKHFLDLVPLREGETDVFEILHRSVYPCLALHYYCPPSVNSVEYLAEICYEPLLLADLLPSERFACAAVRKYMEYRVADDRLGVWLDRSGETRMSGDSVGGEEANGADQESVQIVLSEEDLCLLDEVRCQMGFGLGSSETAIGDSTEEEEREEAEGSLELSITLCNRGVSPVLYAFIKAGLEHLRGDVGEFLSVSLREEMLAGLKLQRPFQTMWSSELRACDHPGATRELVRRAILTVMRYNRSVSDPTLRWYLNADVLERLIQRDRFDIEWSLDIYQEKIDQHHQQFGLTADGNVKALPITEVIHLPDDPQFFAGDAKPEPETEGVLGDQPVVS